MPAAHCEAPFLAGQPEQAESWLRGQCRTRATYRVTLRVRALAHPGLPYSRRARMTPARVDATLTFAVCGKHWRFPHESERPLARAGRWESPGGNVIERL